VATELSNYHYSSLTQLSAQLLSDIDLKMLFDCPECGQKLKAPDNAGGKKCKCSRCQQLVRIPGGAQPTSSASSIPTAWPVAPSSKPTVPPSKPGGLPTKPASVASELDDLIGRQQSQPPAPMMQNYMPSQPSAWDSLQDSRFRGEYTQARKPAPPSGSRVATVIGIVTGVVLLGSIICGVGGYWAYGRKTELSVGRYQVVPCGQGAKQTHHENTTAGQGVLNRYTGSEFWIYTVKVPDNRELREEVQKRFEEMSSEHSSVERGQLNGNRYRNVSTQALRLKSDFRCEMEVFFDEDNMIITCYIPGSEKQRVGIQPKSRPLAIESFVDRPESFFASLTKK
jgi:hypothetical protein